MVSRSEGPRLIVAAACPEARRLGLRPGMKLAHAQAMVPGLRVAAEMPQADADALAGLAAWCLRYTPLTSASPPDGIWLDVTGCAHLLGDAPEDGEADGEAALLSDLSSRLERAGLSSRLALADTPGAAHALARYGSARLTVAPPGDLSALPALPVEALRLGTESIALLHRFGLRRISELAALPRAPLVKRLGAEVVLRLDQAFGRVVEPIEPVQPEVRLAERLAFAEPLLEARSLSAATARLADRLCRRLEARGQGARRLELAFARLDNGRQLQRVGLARASRAAHHIARLFEERLEQVDPGEGIEAMVLTALVSEPLRAGQDTLGAELDRHGLSDVAPLIDRLGNRLGPGRLWRPAPVQSDVPERSVRAVPALDPVRPDWPTAWPAALPRPVRLFDPPLPVRTLTTLPDHPPSFFVWRNHRHQVRRADGPERIAGEWWRRSGEFLAVRDYFRLEDETGRRFWLFRRGDGADACTGDLRWFLHGLF